MLNSSENFSSAVTRKSFIVEKLPLPELAFTNYAYVSQADFNDIAYKIPRNDIYSDRLYLEIKNLVLTAKIHESISRGSLALNICHRQSCKLQIHERIFVSSFDIPQTTGFKIKYIQLRVKAFQVDVSSRNSRVLDGEMLEKQCRKLTKDQILSQHQILCIQVDKGGIPLKLLITDIISTVTKDSSKKSDFNEINRGIITEDTEFLFTAAPEGGIIVNSSKFIQNDIFDHDFNFEELGIGGLDKEFTNIFRRAFASRVFPQSVIHDLGINHVKGILLYGPPGTGKTLLARQIGKALKAREPKIVNGPEILNKYVGQSEENIRLLFKDAEDEYKRVGDKSLLHIIIFDEIDAICKERGSYGVSASVNDSLVNQLLSKIDGVDALNNILLIGMTNRKDLIDDALLRPGRLEVHVEIGLPDETGRLQILKIHTKMMRETKKLHSDVNLLELAAATKNFSGAELEGLVRSAASFAFQRKVDFKDITKPTNAVSIQICRDDFQNALAEVKPMFGMEEEILDVCLQKGIISFSEDFDRLLGNCINIAKQAQDTENSCTLSLLLYGARGCGKTALAAHVAKLSNFPFTKLITPDQFVGKSELAKSSSICSLFEDAHKSQLSFVILDDLERLVDFTPIGPRFSNSVMQSIMVLVKKVSKKVGRRLCIIGTTSDYEFTYESGLANCFNVRLRIPMVTGSEQFEKVLLSRNEDCGDFPINEIHSVSEFLKSSELGIKNLLLIADMASEFSRPDPINREAFLRLMNDYGLNDRSEIKLEKYFQENSIISDHMKLDYNEWVKNRT